MPPPVPPRRITVHLHAAGEHLNGSWEVSTIPRRPLWDCCGHSDSHYDGLLDKRVLSAFTGRLYNCRNGYQGKLHPTSNISKG